VHVLRRRWALAAAVVLLTGVGFGMSRVLGGASSGPGPAAHARARVPTTSNGPLLASPSPSIPPSPSPIPGLLLIADRGNDRALLVDSAKRVLWTYPRQGHAVSMPFHFDDDTFFGPGHTTFISNQEEQQTIQVISFPGGRVLWHYGHVGTAGSGPGYLHTPDDAYVLPDGTRTVADVANCRVLFISPSGRILRQLGTTGVCMHAPPRYLSSPNGDTPLPDGGTLTPVVYPSDAQWLGDGKILLADYSSPGTVLIMTTKGTVLWRYVPRSGPGALDHPSLAIRLPNGLIAVNDDYRDRVVLIDPTTHRIVWQYGHTDVHGAGPGHLYTPDGMDFLPWSVAMGDPEIRTLVVGAP
jgi:hypothetical protein